MLVLGDPTARYCDACQKQDWNAGGHKVPCGTFAPVVADSNGGIRNFIP